ncbi:unnamed protein product [Closterium sp. Naga37s-1]|nr:unnamed protein product [Closterium sp. Naga37s-1]
MGPVRLALQEFTLDEGVPAPSLLASATANVGVEIPSGREKFELLVDRPAVMRARRGPSGGTGSSTSNGSGRPSFLVQLRSWHAIVSSLEEEPVVIIVVPEFASRLFLVQAVHYPAPQVHFPESQVFHTLHQAVKACASGANPGSRGGHSPHTSSYLSSRPPLSHPPRKPSHPLLPKTHPLLPSLLLSCYLSSRPPPPQPLPPPLIPAFSRSSPPSFSPPNVPDLAPPLLLSSPPPLAHPLRPSLIPSSLLSSPRRSSSHPLRPCLIPSSPLSSPPAPISYLLPSLIPSSSLSSPPPLSHPLLPSRIPSSHRSSHPVLP